MSPNPRVDHAHTRSETPSSGIAIPEFGSGSRRIGIAVVAIGSILTIGLGWFVIRASVSETESSIVFQERNFDKAGRRAAIIHLKQIGIDAQVGFRGELFVAPDRLQEAQASLEKAGLKPLTLDEARSVPTGALSILESPEQREQKRREAKEQELAWLIKRVDDVADVTVSLELVAGGKRWIGKSEAARYRVGVFVEPDQIEKGLSDGAVDRIEQIVLASLPNAAPGLLTIHDARKIYRMANRPAGDRNPGSGRIAAGSSLDETALAKKIREAMPDLNGFAFLVSLREVEEGIRTPDAAPAGTENSTRLFFNRPASVSVEVPEVRSGAMVKTRRAKVRIMPTSERESEVASGESRAKLRQRISSIIAPVLVEQVDWLAPPSRSDFAAKTGPNGKTESQPTVSDQVAAKPAADPDELPLTPIDESTRSSLSPWILGGVALAVVLGGGFMWRTISKTPSLVDQEPVTLDESANWATNLSAAAATDRRSAHGPHEIPADKAAEVLSSWLGSVEESESSGA
jgi:hypothetical protein